MKNLPPAELLESTHNFPGPFVFKVVGKSDEGFLARVVAATRESGKIDSDPPFTVRQSSGGRHLSVTVSVEAQSAQHVLDIYTGLSAVEGLVLLL